MGLKYSIIICTFNRSLLLKETIIAILRELVDRQDFEILVIDNNSSDNTREVVLNIKTPSVKYIFEEKQGLSHARNRGMSESKGELLIFLDDDIDIDSNYFKVCEELFLNKNINIVGGKVLPYNIDVPSWLPHRYYYLASIFDLGENTISVKKLMGANYCMRKSTAISIGKYDINLGRKGTQLLGGEEVDYLYRASQIGFNIIYSPLLIVYHKINQKLNLNYIYKYSFELGISENLIDRKGNKLKLILKTVKSLLFFVLPINISSFLFSSKINTWLKINQEYSKGYLYSIWN